MWEDACRYACVCMCVSFDPAPQRLDSIRDHDRWEADVPSLLLCEYNSNFIKTPSIPGIDFSLPLFFLFFFQVPFSFSLLDVQISSVVTVQCLQICYKYALIWMVLGLG